MVTNTATNQFAQIGLSSALLESLARLNYQVPTSIQQQSLPSILKRQDVIAQASTGSGKTLAFALGILQALDLKNFRPQALVICPTRELADQVAGVFRQLARTLPNTKVLSLCGGVPIGPQIGSLAHGAHVVVGTPGRLEAHLRKRTLKLDHLQTWVLDEADRMLDMGFEEAIQQISTYLPKAHQTLLFSATYPEQIQQLAQGLMQSPLMLEGEALKNQPKIKQQFYLLDAVQAQLQALHVLLVKHRLPSVLVFCNTKIQTKTVAQYLQTQGFAALAIHGDLEQWQREEALVRFANGSINVLVATDVAARGLDIDNLGLIISFDLAHEHSVHTHRIGRTGRAGQKGLACHLCTPKDTYRLGTFGFEVAGLFSTPLPGRAYLDKHIRPPEKATIKIDGGKKQKLRPGDIVGALTGHQGVPGDSIGKIDVLANHTYVAIESNWVKPALRKIHNDRIKKKAFKARVLNLSKVL